MAEEQDQTERRRDDTERWFVRRGLPHLIDHYSLTEDVLTRMFPFLSLVVFLELFLVFGDRWKGWSQAVAFLAGVVAMLVTFLLINRLRGRPRFQLPERVGAAEVLIFLTLPAIPTAIGAQDALAENIASIVVVNIVILAAAYGLTTWGLIPMMRWSVGQLRAQIGDVATLAMKSLPTLLIFSAFIFLNAEMWQVANNFSLPYFLAVAVLITGIGGAFVLVSVRRLTVDLARFSSWADVRARCSDTPVVDLVPLDDAPPPDAGGLGRSAEWNIALLLFVAQAIQILLVATVITLFYLIFGLLTVREDTLLQWTTVSELTRDADWAFRWSVLGDQVVFTRQLVVVSSFIGLMSGLQFAVQIVTDSTYRSEFAEEMTAEVREALAVRTVYLRRLVPTPGD